MFFMLKKKWQETNVSNCSSVRMVQFGRSAKKVDSGLYLQIAPACDFFLILALVFRVFVARFQPPVANWLHLEAPQTFSNCNGARRFPFLAFLLSFLAFCRLYLAARLAKIWEMLRTQSLGISEHLGMVAFSPPTSR